MPKTDPTEQEEFVRSVYSLVDEASARELARLRTEDGIFSSCKLGCCYCCSHHVLASILEAHTLALFIKRELSLEEVEALRTRTRQWHEWDNSRPGRYPSPRLEMQTDLSNYEHRCPLVVDGACIVYPVRPIVCRTHFVSSPPLFCREANYPQSTEEAPVALSSVLTETSPFSMAIRDRIEGEGFDFSHTIMPLPQWLAVEMGWDCAII